MNEKEFWGLPKKMRQNGREQQIICTTEGVGFPEQDYLQGHTLLPKGYDKLTDSDIINIGVLLFDREVKHKTKETAMIILAHQSSEAALTILAKYNLNPDKELEFFAQMALDECAMWNE